jgi:hypothetical protein
MMIIIMVIKFNSFGEKKLERENKCQVTDHWRRRKERRRTYFLA